MADAGDVRLEQAHQRQNEEIVRWLEASEAARAEPDPPRADLPRADVGAVDGRVADVPGHDDSSAHHAILPAPGGEPAVEMRVEDDDGEELIGALAEEGLGLPLSPNAAREANDIYEMLLVRGVSRGDAAAKVAELCSPPRVTAELGRLSVMSLVGGSTFDLWCGANGEAWDFRRG